VSRPRLLLAGLLAVGVIVFGLVRLASDGQPPFRIDLRLSNAAGLREGSEVKVAGTPVGKVASIELGRGDVVRVGLEISRDKAQVGRGATVAIRSANLLGQKFVDLRPGDTTRPAASGLLLQGASISTPVDLDQVFGVLDADTRTRLGVLINEAGTGLLGRHADVATLLRSLPSDLDQARQLMDQLAGDNRSLRQLVARSQRVTSRLAPERRALGEVVRTAGDAMETVSARRVELADTLRRAPGALDELRGFLDQLRATTVPLGPAARRLSSTAPALRSTLEALEPFRTAAAPVLDEAKATAPALQRLGDRATPVVRTAGPTLRALNTLAGASPPLTKALDLSIDDILGFMQGWARATQNRDGVGHYFQGQASFGPEILRTAVNRLLAEQAPAPSSRRRSGTKRPGAASPGGSAQPDSSPKLPGSGPVRDAVDELDSALDAITGRSPSASHKPGARQPSSALLDFLLAP
jgi:virulence factor Mce-like protein